jgi:hypothetical protein
LFPSFFTYDKYVKDVKLLMFILVLRILCHLRVEGASDEGNSYGENQCEQDFWREIVVPLQSKNLDADLQNKLQTFYNRHDFCELYKSYSWLEDTWANGFPRILSIENDLRSTSKRNQVTNTQIITIADWGRLLSKKRIRFGSNLLSVQIFQCDGLPLAILAENPSLPLNELDNQTSGLGPTYLSKVLRFLAPMEYGAIDTRIVRTFGKSASKQDDSWLSLEVQMAQNGRFSIPRNQKNWPSDYSKWINILRFFAEMANASDSEQLCPHPSGFVEMQLRYKNKWACADIEMSLFSYASRQTKP